MKIIHTRDGDQFEIRPCPSWCTDEHFPPDEHVDSDDGFHHCGPDVSIPTSHQPFTGKECSTVRLYLKTWVLPLDAEPGTGCVDLTLFTADGEPTVELTSREARTLAAALVQLADTAERAQPRRLVVHPGKRPRATRRIRRLAADLGRPPGRGKPDPHTGD
jgi:hypothetical protein